MSIPLPLNTFYQDLGLIIGNLYSVYSGFIVIIWFLFGVPRTFIISTICSKEESPAKIGCCNTNSAIMHPPDHKSIAGVYSVAPKINSGARYGLEDIYETFACPGTNIFA